jgi:hypothetical protein
MAHHKGTRNRRSRPVQIRAVSFPGEKLTGTKSVFPPAARRHRHRSADNNAMFSQTSAHSTTGCDTAGRGARSKARWNQSSRREASHAAARFVSRKRAGSVRRESDPAIFPERRDLVSRLWRLMNEMRPKGLWPRPPCASQYCLNIQAGHESAQLRPCPTPLSRGQ